MQINSRHWFVECVTERFRVRKQFESISVVPLHVLLVSTYTPARRQRVSSNGLQRMITKCIAANAGIWNCEMHCGYKGHVEVRDKHCTERCDLRREDSVPAGEAAV